MNASLAGLMGAGGAAWALGVLLKGTLLLVAAFALAAALRRGSAALRHLVWSGGIAALLILPFASLALPWRLPVLHLPAVAAPAPAAGEGRAAPAFVAPAATGLLAERAAVRATEAGPAAAAPFAGPGLLGRLLAAATWPRLLVALWLAGALLVLARLVRGALVVRRELRRATALQDPQWQRLLVEAADRLGMAREPRLLSSEHVLMPVVCGLVRPAIVLPAGAGEWTERRRRAVLCHELAHVRRSDVPVTILSRVGCALYWFHPLVWLAARRLRLESERACDDLVLGVGTRASEYADHLLQIACGALAARTPATALPMAERSEFEGRMLAILDEGTRRSPASRRHTAALAAAGLVVVLPLAAMGMARAPAQAPERQAPSVDGPTAGTPSGRPAGSTVLSTSSQTRTSLHVARHTVVDSSRAGAAAIPAAPPGATSAPDTGDAQAVAALLSTLEDSVAAVRLDAAYALGRLEAAAAVERLGAHLRGDGAAEVRKMAAWALGQIGTPATTPALGAAATGDAADDVRAMAIWALGQGEDAAAVPALVAALHDAAAENRGRAAWALGQVGPHAAPPALIAALRDPAGAVRFRAAWALGQIGDAAAGSALAAVVRDSAADVRRAALWAIGRMDSPAARSVLIELLKDPDPDVRARAARSLAGSGGEPWPWPWPMPINR